MRKTKAAKLLMAMGAVGALAMGAGVTLAATGDTKAPEASKTPAVSSAPAISGKQEGKEMKAVRGQVAAVDFTAKTLSVKPTHGKNAEAIGVEVSDTAKITEGKATKALTDIKVGDRIYMRYDRTSDKLVADHIRILRPGKTASQSASKNKSS